MATIYKCRVIKSNVLNIRFVNKVYVQKGRERNTLTQRYSTFLNPFLAHEPYEIYY